MVCCTFANLKTFLSSLRERRWDRGEGKGKQRKEDVSRMKSEIIDEIVETGTADEVFENPQHSYTRMLIDAIPKVVL